MFEVFISWYRRRFSDPAAITLAVLLAGSFILLWLFGNILMPLLIALVLAYLCDGTVNLLERWHCPRGLGATLVASAIIGLMLLGLLVLLPLIWQQGTTLVGELPNMLAQLKILLLNLPERYPDTISQAQIDVLVDSLRTRLLALGEVAVSASLGSLLSAVAIVVYAILVPLLLFFLLKDKRTLITSIKRYLPANRQLAEQVMAEMNQQAMNYVRGKVLEIVVVGVASYFLFWGFGLNYAVLLAVAVGLSVLIPYIGATVVTIPVVLVALFQWGVGPTFWYVVSGYLIIQMLDGNVLVPVLFSEAVNLHPVAIIVAVLFFGGIWGFWGVFFAIPLATLVKAVVNAWPTSRSSETSASA